MDSNISLDCADGIATIALNNPAKLNAVNAAMWRGLSAAMQRVANDPSIRCVILRGVGVDDYLYLLMPLRVSSTD